MKRETSAVILASGAGSRLGEITTDTPKSLLEFGRQPYLQRLVNWLLRSGIDDITITTQTCANVIEEFVDKTWPAHVATIREPSLVSTIQSAQYGLEQTRHETSLLLTADNIWNINPRSLTHHHYDSNAHATSMVTGKPDVPNAGKVQVAVDSDTIVQMWPRPERSKLEGPTRPASTMGLYVVNKTALLSAIHPGDTSIEREPMDRLTPNVAAYWNEEFFFDYGTPDNYAYLQAHPEIITTYL